MNKNKIHEKFFRKKEKEKKESRELVVCTTGIVFRAPGTKRQFQQGGRVEGVETQGRRDADGEGHETE